MFLKLQSSWKICPVHWIRDSHNYQVYTEIEATFAVFPAILRKNELAFMLYKNVHMFLGIFKATIFWIYIWYTAQMHYIWCSLSLWSKCCYPHFLGNETEAQEVNSPRVKQTVAVKI